MTEAAGEQVVWDFRTPVTAIDMGSPVDELVEVGGPVDLEVVFPSGRAVSGLWANGAVGFAQGGANLGDAPPQPISLVDLIEAEAHSVDEVRASADRFIEEFGPAVAGSAESSIEEFLDGFASRVDAAGGQIRVADHGTLSGGGGPTARSFGAAEQDGLRPSWLVSVVPGGVTLRTSVAFEPAASP